jgi:predicted permease
MNWQHEVRAEFARRLTAVDDTVVEELAQHAAAAFEAARADGDTPEGAAAHVESLIASWCAGTSGPRRLARAPLLESAPAASVVSPGFWFDVLRHDLRYALRQIRCAPIFAIVVVATLAIGVGGTTAVFSVVEGVVLAPLPYDEPGRLVRLYQQEPGKPDTRTQISGVHFGAVRDEAASFEDVAVMNTYSEHSLDLVAGGQARRIRVLQVTSGYFRTLRIGLDGPGFARDDESGSRRVVLSHSLWRTVFPHDPPAAGSTIRLNGGAYEVAGIGPPGFVDPMVGEIDAWVPYNLARDVEPQNYSVTMIGRLRPGATIDQAAAELAAMSASMEARWPTARRSRLVPLPMKDDLVAASRRPLQLFLAAVALMLLVACVNVANLVLVRATGRVQEFAVRAALGSSRGRLASQLVMESAILAALGGALGVAVAHFGIGTLRRLGDGTMPRLQDVGLNASVLVFAGAVTAATAMTFAVVPALRLARIAPNDALRRQSRSATGTRAQARVRSGLAAAQLALALTLLVGAAALVDSFVRLHRVHLGFRTDGVLTFEVGLPSARYDEDKRAAFQEALARTLAAIPGVAAAGGTSRLPATGSYHPWTARILTGPRAGVVLSRSRGINLQNRTISGGFLDALAIPVLAGRAFDDRDDAKAPARVVVSANLAREAFPGMPFEAVVGQRIAPLGQPRDIIGVVGDVTLDVYGAPSHVVYHAHRQFASNRNWTLTQAVATPLRAEQVLPSIRAAVGAMDPELVVHRPMPLADVVGRGVARERFALVLVGSFASVALLLAVLGLYGVLTYTVRQRTQEIGIRVALGATAAQVRALVLKHAAGVVALGLAGGLAGALAAGRSLSSLLFQVNATDGRILVASAAIVAFASLLSAWLPARRAARLPPRVTLQEL